MWRSRHSAEVPDAKLKRLAQRIDRLTQKDDQHLQLAQDTARLRRSAAAELHTICRDFVQSVNRLLERAELALDPADFSQDYFQEDGLNLAQISVRGRILQVAFSATPELLSTEDFRVPYTLEGSIRAFNQELLDKEIIEEQLLFYTVEKDRKMWRYFDPRTYRSGAFDQEYLISLMDQLI